MGELRAIDVLRPELADLARRVARESFERIHERHQMSPWDEISEAGHDRMIDQAAEQIQAMLDAGVVMVFGVTGLQVCRHSIGWAAGGTDMAYVRPVRQEPARGRQIESSSGEFDASANAFADALALARRHGGAIGYEITVKVKGDVDV